ncbi:MAG: hypothetical protein ACTSPY_18040 [Candidatus Helarchaeota archaeon]
MNYKKFLKKRSIRLYVGYFLGLGFIFIVKYICMNLPTISIWTLFLDFSSLWPVIIADYVEFGPKDGLFVLYLCYH